MRLQFQLNNLDNANALVPIAHPMSMFTNIKLYAGGQLCENIEELGPLANILDKLKPYVRRVNDSMMSHVIVGGSGHLDARTPMAASASRRCILELPLGVFRTQKMIPLHLVSGLTVELTLGDAKQAFADSTTGTGAVDRSSSWDISDVSLMANCLHANSLVHSIKTTLPRAWRCQSHSLQ